MDQIVQLFGAMCVLAGFAAVQFQRLRPESLPYLTINAVGSGLLAVLAFRERQWGFLLLEGVWCVVSLWGLWRWGALAWRRGGKPEHDAVRSP